MIDSCHFRKITAICFPHIDYYWQQVRCNSALCRNRWIHVNKTHKWRHVMKLCFSMIYVLFQKSGPGFNVGQRSTTPHTSKPKCLWNLLEICILCVVWVRFTTCAYWQFSHLETKNIISIDLARISTHILFIFLNHCMQRIAFNCLL